MTGTSEPLLESRPAGPIWILPILIVGMAVLLVVAWILVNLVVEEAVADFGLVVAVAVGFSLVLAGVWTWGIRRARLVVIDDELTIAPILARTQSVSLTRLAVVDIQPLPGNRAAVALYATDADGASVAIVSKGWEREADVLRLIGEAARRSGAAVSQQAADAIARGWLPG